MTKKRIILPVCILSALFSLFKTAVCQDLSSPRFFTFDIQSLSPCSAPILPQQMLASYTPDPKAFESNFLYEFALRFPIKLKGHTRLFGEVSQQNEYSSGFYGFNDGKFDDLEPLELFQTSGSLIMLHQFDEQWRLTTLLNIRSNSNRHFNFDRRALRFSNVSMLENKTEKRTLGFGAMISVNQNFSMLPIIRYETNFNDKWGIDILFPSRVLAVRNFSKSTRLLLGARGDAATYFLTGEDGMQDAFIGSNFRRISVNGIVGFEKQITPLVGFTAEAGASFPYKGGIFDHKSSKIGLHDFQNRISPHFNVGFFLSLPR